MKKLLSVMITLAMLLALCACGMPLPERTPQPTQTPEPRETDA